MPRSAEEMERLSSDASPRKLWADGRYVYKRECDGHIQWDYPVVTHDDMDICTTPPHEEEESSRGLLPPGVSEVVTPPPPTWSVSSPSNVTEEPPPLPKDPPPPQLLGDELQLFYNDIAEIEKQTPNVNVYPPLPPTPTPPKIDVRTEEVKSKKKSKVKISCSIGPKNKSVSTLVAKWQQVADEIHSE